MSSKRLIVLSLFLASPMFGRANSNEISDCLKREVTKSASKFVVVGGGVGAAAYGVNALVHLNGEPKREVREYQFTSRPKLNHWDYPEARTDGRKIGSNEVQEKSCFDIEKATAVRPDQMVIQGYRRGRDGYGDMDLFFLGFLADQRIPDVDNLTLMVIGPKNEHFSGENALLDSNERAYFRTTESIESVNIRSGKIRLHTDLDGDGSFDLPEGKYRIRACLEVNGHLEAYDSILLDI